MTNLINQMIAEVRSEIDAVDDAINALLAQRTELVHKMKHTKKNEVAVFQPDREQEIIKRIVRQNASSLSDVEIAKIFTQIITSCRMLEESIGES